jgi:hypothetical protein
MSKYGARRPARQVPPSVTGRDGYIQLQALAYAIVAIELLPPRRQERSNREDMKLLLDHFCSDQWFKQDLLKGAKAHLTGVGWGAVIEHEPSGDNVISFPTA